MRGLIHETPSAVQRYAATRRDAGLPRQVRRRFDENLLDAVAPANAGTGRTAKAVRSLARRLFTRELVSVALDPYQDPRWRKVPMHRTAEPSVQHHLI